MRVLTALTIAIAIAACGGEDAARIDRSPPTLDASPEVVIATPDGADEPPLGEDAGTVDSTSPPVDARAEVGLDVAVADAAVEPPPPPTDAAPEREAMAPADVAADGEASADSFTPDAGKPEPSPEAGHDAVPDATQSDAPPTCPAMPRPDGTSITEGARCCDVTCTPQGFTCASNTCGWYTSSRPALFDDNAFGQGGAPRGLYWLLPESASSLITATLTIGIAQETGCVRIMTAGGRYVRDPFGVNAGACFVQSFSASSNPSLAIELVTEPGDATGWTVFQSSRLVNNACPLACP